MAKRNYFWLGFAVVGVAVLLAYSNSLQGVFFFDDGIAIVQNKSIHTLGGSLSPPRELPVSGRPLVNLSFAINYAWGGLQPEGYHVVNLGLHLASTLLVALIAGTLLPPKLSKAERNTLALGMAAVWALHPLNTEAVDYVTQRTELFVSCFALVTIWTTAMYWKSNARGWNVVGIAACFAGLLAKESAAMIPLIVPLVDRVASNESWRSLPAKRGKVYAAYFSSWFLLLVIMMTSPRSDSAGLNLGITPLEYLATQCWAIPRYLAQAFWPAGLCIDYGTDTFPLSQTWPGGVLLIVLFAVACWGILKAPGVGLLLGSFFLWLAPTSSLLPIITEVGAERRMYLPLLCVVALVMTSVWKLLPAQHRVRSFLAISGLLSVALGIVTYQRNAIYHSQISIWEDAIAKLPHNFRANYNLAMAQNDAGQTDQAIANYRLALEKMTHDRLLAQARTQSQLAVVLSNRGESKEALALVEEALGSVIPSSEVHVNLAAVLAKQGKLAEAAEQLRKATKMNPQNAVAQTNYGMLLAALGKHADAEERLAQALVLDPQLDAARQALKNLNARAGQHELSSASETEPNSAEHWIRLAAQARLAGETSKAIHCYENALQLEPKNAFALNSLGAMLVRTDSKRAMQLYDQAIKADPKLVEAYCNLATGLARAGRLEEAISKYETALEVDPNYQPAQKNLQIVREMLQKKN